MVKEIRAIAPTGSIGAGFDEDSFHDAMERVRPDFLGVDAGSTDPGPHALGTGIPHYSRSAYRRDLGIMLRAARRWEVPLLIGSAGTAGGDANVAWVQDVIHELAAESDLHFNLGVIRAEQDKEYLKRKLKEGKIQALYPEIDLSDEVIDRSEHVVGMMGVEPFQEALRQGADVVLAGRSSDTSIFAAIPMERGFPAGLVWHCAKVLECGGAASVHTTASGLDGMIATIREDSFDLEPTNPAMRVTPASIASHTLYENRSPFHLVEPSGTLDVSGASYEALDSQRVQVRGSQFSEASDYSIKLEGCELAGYQSIVVAGVRDPEILRQFDEWLHAATERAWRRLRDIFGADRADLRLHVRVYGRDGVMGQLEPKRAGITGHEVCIIFEGTAATQSDADTIAHVSASIISHHPIPQWSGLITTLAYPYSPTCIPRGPVYRYNMNHVVMPDHPLEMFRVEKVAI